MSTIVKFKNPKTNITYAYESVPYYDPEKKQSRPKRKYLGRVDDETGEIITTTGTRGRSKGDSGTKTDKDKRIKELNEVIKSQKETIQALKKRIQELEENEAYVLNETDKIQKRLESR